MGGIHSSQPTTLQLAGNALDTPPPSNPGFVVGVVGISDQQTGLAIALGNSIIHQNDDVV